MPQGECIGEGQSGEKRHGVTNLTDLVSSRASVSLCRICSSLTRLPDLCLGRPLGLLGLRDLVLSVLHGSLRSVSCRLDTLLCDFVGRRLQLVLHKSGVHYPLCQEADRAPSADAIGKLPDLGAFFGGSFNRVLWSLSYEATAAVKVSSAHLGCALGLIGLWNLLASFPNAFLRGLAGRLDASIGHLQPTSDSDII